MYNGNVKDVIKKFPGSLKCKVVIIPGSMWWSWPFSLWAGLDIAGSQLALTTRPTPPQPNSRHKELIVRHILTHTISDIISWIFWLQAGLVYQNKKWVESYIFSCFRSGYCSLCCLSMLLVRWRMTSCLQSRDSSTKYTSGNMKMSGTALSLNFSTIIYRLNTPLTRCRVPHFPRITKYQMSKEYF